MRGGIPRWTRRSRLQSLAHVFQRKDRLPGSERILRVGLMALVVVSSCATAQEGEESVAEDSKRLELHLYLQGRHLFQKNCVECHGTAGRGDGPWADELETKPRNFRLGLFKFRTTAFGTLPVDNDLRRTIRSGISGTAMPVFAHLRDDEIDAIIAYLKQLSRSWRDPSQRPRPLPLPETPAWFADPAESARHADDGKALFVGLCSACHGSGAEGDGEAGKRLVDGAGNPIRPADLTTPHLKSGDAPADLYRTIATGLNGTPMVGYAGILDESAIWTLVAYIRQSRKDP